MSFPSVISKYLSSEIISAEAVIREWEDSGLFDKASWAAESAILIYDRRLYAQLLATFDPDEVGFENIRFGAPGSKKIARQWADRKISTETRAVLPVLEVGDRLLWVGLLGGASDAVQSGNGKRAKVSIYWAPVS